MQKFHYKKKKTINRTILDNPKPQPTYRQVLHQVRVDHHVVLIVAVYVSISVLRDGAQLHRQRIF